MQYRTREIPRGGLLNTLPDKPMSKPKGLPVLTKVLEALEGKEDPVSRSRYLELSEQLITRNIAMESSQANSRT